MRKVILIIGLLFSISAQGQENKTSGNTKGNNHKPMSVFWTNYGMPIDTTSNPPPDSGLWFHDANGYKYITHTTISKNVDSGTIILHVDSLTAIKALMHHIYSTHNRTNRLKGMKVKTDEQW